tara:strand:+ start:383 stop:637 length:255 start_codon:yes stop_codon:yes gene_type:complete
MNDDRIRRLIMENLPNTPEGQASKIYLKIAVQQDASAFSQDISNEDFDRNLSWLNTQQCLVVFRDGFVRATASGLNRYELINKY